MIKKKDFKRAGLGILFDEEMKQNLLAFLGFTWEISDMILGDSFNWELLKNRGEEYRKFAENMQSIESLGFGDGAIDADFDDLTSESIEEDFIEDGDWLEKESESELNPTAET